jgi:hypothetical protein
MTEDTPGVADLVKAPEDPAAFDVFAPGNVSPFVAWLATEQCPATGQIFYVKGGDVRLYSGWHHEPLLETNARWTVENLVSAMAGTSLAPA